MHRPLAPHENVDAEMVWREQRTVTGALTLHYNKAMFILEPTLVSEALARKRVEVTKMIPLTILRSSTRGMPCDSGKYGSIRRICASLSIHNSLTDSASSRRH